MCAHINIKNNLFCFSHWFNCHGKERKGNSRVCYSQRKVANSHLLSRSSLESCMVSERNTHFTALPSVWDIWPQLLFTNHLSHFFNGWIRGYKIVIRQLVIFVNSYIGLKRKEGRKKKINFKEFTPDHSSNRQERNTKRLITGAHY